MDLNPKKLLRFVVERARAELARRISSAPPLPATAPPAVAAPERTHLRCERVSEDRVSARWEVDERTQALAHTRLSPHATLVVRCVVFQVDMAGEPRRVLLEQVGVGDRGQQTWVVPPEARCVVSVGLHDSVGFVSLAHDSA